MDERGQLVPLNLCTPTFLMRELKSLNSGFLQPPPTPPPQPFPTPQPLASSQSGRLTAAANMSDLEVPLFSRATGGFCSPSGGTSMLLPDYQIQQKSLEDEPKPNFSYIGEFINCDAVKVVQWVKSFKILSAWILMSMEMRIWFNTLLTFTEWNFLAFQFYLLTWIIRVFYCNAPIMMTRVWYNSWLYAFYHKFIQFWNAAYGNSVTHFHLTWKVLCTWWSERALPQNQIRTTWRDFFKIIKLH